MATVPVQTHTHNKIKQPSTYSLRTQLKLASLNINSTRHLELSWRTTPPDTSKYLVSKFGFINYYSSTNENSCYTKTVVGQPFQLSVIYFQLQLWESINSRQKQTQFKYTACLVHRKWYRHPSLNYWMCFGISPFLNRDREYSAASIRSSMLWMDRSSEPSIKIARTSAFLDNLAARFKGKAGELRLLKICLYSESTLPLFLAKSSAVAHIRPFAISHWSLSPVQEIAAPSAWTLYQTLGVQ